MYAEAGVAATPAATGIFLSGIFGFGIRLLIPTVALTALATTGRLGPTGVTVAILAAVRFIATAGFLGVAVALARFVRWVGSLLERFNNRVLTRFGRPTIEGPADEAEVLRRRMQTTLASRWRVALGADAVGQALMVTIFVLSYRYIGLTPDVVTPFQAFATYAAGLIANFIPFIPGGIGASELIHVLLLTEFTGADIADEVAAAGFTHRTFTWVPPLVIGGIFLVGWLRRRSVAAATRQRG